MNPLVWGPPFWFVMHTVSLNYPVDPSYSDKRTHYDFYYIIRNILPCVMCRQHYTELLKQYPLEPFLDSRESLISWVILIHNQVNQRLGTEMVTREAVLEKYEQAYARQSFCKAPTALDCDAAAGDDVRGSSHAITLRSHTPVHPWYTSGWLVVLLITTVVVLCIAYIIYALYKRRHR